MSSHQINLVFNIQATEDISAQVQKITTMLSGATNPAQSMNITVNAMNQGTASKTPHLDAFLKMQTSTTYAEQAPLYNRESISEQSSQSSDSSEIPLAFLRNVSIPNANDYSENSSALFAESDKKSSRGGKQFSDSIFDQDFLNVRNAVRATRGDDATCLGKRTHEQRGQRNQTEEEYCSPKFGFKLRSVERVYQSETETPAAPIKNETSEPKSKAAHQPKYDRKDNSQLQILLKAFDESAVWSYAEKVRIAEQVGMTYHKVSKWNWDHRKKMGLDTNRRTQKAADKLQ